MSVNKSVKEYLRGRFQEWYSDQVAKQLASELPATSIGLQMSVVKPLGAKWLIDLCDYMKLRLNIILNGFKKAGTGT